MNQKNRKNATSSFPDLKDIRKAPLRIVLQDTHERGKEEKPVPTIETLRSVAAVARELVKRIRRP